MPAEREFSFAIVPDIAIVRLGARTPSVLPPPCRSVSTPHGEILWRGPSQWWLKSRTHTAAAMIAEPDLARCAIDISDSLATFSVAGKLARIALAAGCPLDLHRRAFPQGSVAATRYDLFDIVLHARGEAAFELHVGRSYAEDARHWLERSFAQTVAAAKKELEK